MIGNYLKTAGRNLLRNKLFSSINIIGLSISMTVGLLMVALLSDLLSYDNFHEKKNHIYRVTTTEALPDGQVMELASTSVKAGQKIRETIPGVEQVTIVRRGFGGDATIGDHTIPLSGLWADNSFFQIFTFPLLEGNPATALKEPYSLVLTEKTAKKLFGNSPALGKWVKLDSMSYVVTGIMQDIPKQSHMQFEALVSFSTVELQKPDADGGFLSWDNIFMNYIYLSLPGNGNRHTLQANLDKLSAEENARLENKKLMLKFQPLTDIALGRNLVNPIGPVMPVGIVWMLGGLTLIVILSACFNYTNLTIARSLKRSREVGIRKVIGARKSHVMGQFVFESLFVAMIALVFAFLLFMLLRKHFLSLHPFLENMATLYISIPVILSFIALSMLIGLIAGFLPAVFFSRINAIQSLKNSSSLQLFRRVTLRKVLIVTQYTISLVFITATLIIYKQYRHFISFNLGFSTSNILTIPLQGNKAHLLQKEFEAIPQVEGFTKSLMISSLGSYTGMHLKYNNPEDSALVYYNLIDENYLPLYHHQLLAGKNFMASAVKHENGVIVNEQVLQRFNIGQNDPVKAIGESLILGNSKLIITGVVKDFHHETPFSKIKPFIFRYSPDAANYLHVKITSGDWPSTLASMDKAWRKVDKIHPIEASFYDDQIKNSYNQFFVLIKIMGFLSFLAVSVSSMGLFGMVVFTTETRIKEVSMRKVMGASEANLVYILSKEFVFLLVGASFIALPAILVLNNLILNNVAYPAPVFTLEIAIGILLVLLMALLMIGSLTIRAAQSNPAQVLKNE